MIDGSHSRAHITVIDEVYLFEMAVQSAEGLKGELTHMNDMLDVSLGRVRR